MTQETTELLDQESAQALENEFTNVLEQRTDRTEIYNSIAQIRDAFYKLTDNKDVLEFFEVKAKTIVKTVASIADERDALLINSIQSDK